METGLPENADTITVFTRFFLPSFILIIVLLVVYVIYRWKVAADRRELLELDPERMKLKVEALAAEKLAMRKATEAKQKKPIQDPDMNQPSGEDVEDGLVSLDQ